MVKVSVIIPTFNRSKLLKNAINSVLNQTFSDLEIIIIDDNSTDDTEQFIEGLNNKKIYYVKNPTSLKAAKSRNIGINLANGEYIALLDDDDEWLNEKLEKQLVEFRADKKLGAVFTGSNVIYLDENYSYVNIPSKEGYVGDEIYFRNLFGTNSSALIKKSLLSELGGYDEDFPAMQDHDLWVRISNKSKVKVVKEPLINYYFRTNSKQITTNIDNYNLAVKLFLEKHILHNNSLNDTKKNRVVIGFNIGFVSRMHRVGEVKTARNFIINKMKLSFNMKYLLAFFSTYINFKYLSYFHKLVKKIMY